MEKEEHLRKQRGLEGMTPMVTSKRGGVVG